MATFLGRGLWVCVGMCMCVPLGVRVCNANVSIFVLLWGLEGASAVFEERQEKEVLISFKWFLFIYYYYGVYFLFIYFLKMHILLFKGATDSCGRRPVFIQCVPHFM